MFQSGTSTFSVNITSANIGNNITPISAIGNYKIVSPNSIGNILSFLHRNTNVSENMYAPMPVGS